MMMGGSGKSPSSNSRRSGGSRGGGHNSLGHNLSHSHEPGQCLYFTLRLCLSLDLKSAILRLAKWLPETLKKTSWEVIRTTLAAFFLILFAATPALAGDKVVARVGKEPITLSEVETQRAQNPDLTRDQILESLIERRLVLSWAKRNDLTISEEEIDSVERSLMESNKLTAGQFQQALRDRGDTTQTFRDGLREQILINRALGIVLRDRMSVSEDEIDQLYRESFPTRDTFVLKHILFTVPEGASDTETEEVNDRAVEVYSKLQNGASFDAMVRQYSQDTSSVETGGRLGTFRSGELIPELENAIVTLKAGEVGEPVRTAAGYHIVLVESRGTENPPPLNTVRDQMQKRLMAGKEAAARREWIGEIRKETYVEVFDKSE